MKQPGSGCKRSRSPGKPVPAARCWSSPTWSGPSRRGAAGQAPAHSGKRWPRLRGDPPGHGADHESLPLLALRVQVPGIVVYREAMLGSFDLARGVNSPVEQWGASPADERGTADQPEGRESQLDITSGLTHPLRPGGCWLSSPPGDACDMFIVLRPGS